MSWYKVDVNPPPEETVIDTKIDDEKGVRNHQHLVWRGGIWWVADGRTYVYYSPTHWRYVS